MKRAILVITRNSSHIFPHFIRSYKRYVDKSRYDLWWLDNGSREGDVEYINTYVKDRTIYRSIHLEATLG
jgi:hypothetical protein